MDASASKTTFSSRQARRRFLLGAATALFALLTLAECFLRSFPPQDLHPFLGEEAPLSGIYRADPDLGFTYRSFDDFAAENKKALRPWLPLDEPPGDRPIWAMFGNSFVHMRGQLADTVRASVHDHAVFNLGRNELLPLRVAQVKLLLEAGLRPERVFFGLMPVDLYGLVEQPLDTYHVTERGALTYTPILPPGPLGWFAQNSRLALTAWCRTGMQKGNLRVGRNQVVVGVPEPMRSDVRRLMRCLAEAARQHEVPVTVLLIPPHQQVERNEKCGFQDDLTPDLRELGLDVFDPREAFLRHPDRRGLFIPDKHYSKQGCRLLMAELMGHLDRVVVREVSAP